MMVMSQLETKQTKNLSHQQILGRFEKVFESKTKTEFKLAEDVRLQYLIFVANVASKLDGIHNHQYYHWCLKQLLDQSNNFLKFNKNLINRIAKRNKMNALLKKKVIDENKHIKISETVLINLLDLSEPLDDEETEELILKTKNTKFNQLKVKLLEKQEDFA